jgi:hypothetical protein
VIVEIGEFSESGEAARCPCCGEEAIDDKISGRSKAGRLGVHCPSDSPPRQG